MSDTSTDPRCQLGGKTIAEPLSPAAMAEHPLVDSIATQRAKLESDGPGKVDWSEVLRAGAIILGELGKDLPVATLYGYGLFWRERLPGLAIALTILDDLLTTAWDSLTPPVKRLRARANAVQWLGDRIQAHYAALATAPPPADDMARALAKAEAASAANAPALAICQARLKSIDACFAGLDHQPNLIDLRRMIDRMALEAEELAKAQAPKPPPAADPDPAATAKPAAHPAPDAGATQPTPPPPPPPVQAAPAVALPSQPAVRADMSADQLENALAQSCSTLRQLAKLLLAHKLADPRPYQLNRIGIWGTLTAPPLVTQTGCTNLVEPTPDRVRYLSKLVADGEHKAALPEIESSIGNAPFWLDGHRLAATCLQGLGPDFAAARAVVIDALAGLLRRFPTLPDLKFQTKTPFADAMTLAWIKSEVLGGDGGGGPVEVWQVALDDARGLAASGKIDEAARLLAAGRAGAEGGRARIYWDLAQAQFAFEIKRLPVAQQILETLDDCALAEDLDAWEPALAVRIIRPLLACYAALPAVKPPTQGVPPAPVADPPHKLRMARLQARLAQLDLASALTSTG